MVYVYTVERERDRETERETYYLSDKHVLKKVSPTICSVQTSRRFINLPSLLIFDNDSASAASLAMILAHEDNRQHTDSIIEYHRVSQTLRIAETLQKWGEYPVPECARDHFPIVFAHPVDSC